MTTPPPGSLDRIKQVVGDRQIEGIAAERLTGLLSGWQMPTSLEYALIADATGVTVLWLLNGHDEEAQQPSPASDQTPSPQAPLGLTLGQLRQELAVLTDLPDTALVVMASSPEALHHSPAAIGALHEAWYEGDVSGGVIYMPASLRENMDPDEFPPPPDSAAVVPAVCLYPQG